MFLFSQLCENFEIFCVNPTVLLAVVKILKELLLDDYAWFQLQVAVKRIAEFAKFIVA